MARHTENPLALDPEQKEEDWRQWLLTWMSDCEISSSALAHEVGVSTDTVRGWRKGDFFPTSGNLRKISEIARRGEGPHPEDVDWHELARSSTSILWNDKP